MCETVLSALGLGEKNRFFDTVSKGGAKTKLRQAETRRKVAVGPVSQRK